MATQRSLFISDLHLCSSRPHATEAFLHFMRCIAPGAEALYILGDLFEYWAGDDDLDDPFHQKIIESLHTLSANGTLLFFMHGNRDFLIAEEFAAACAAKLLPDPTLINLYGVATLLTHGDTLCTDDVDYQAFRRQVRDTAWIRQFLALPLAQRKEQIEALRARSEAEKATKDDMIMDVSAQAVADLFRTYNYPRLIHGHTHRLAHHLHRVDTHVCERWVLGDWDEEGNVLECSVQGCRINLFRAHS